jgi:hypothetical protein
MRKTIQHKNTASISIENPTMYDGSTMVRVNNTIHDDLNIPYITDEIKKRANRYRTRITDHENQLIDDLSYPHQNARRLKKTWPEIGENCRWAVTASKTHTCITFTYYFLYG